MFTHYCSIIPDGPSHVQFVLLGMKEASKPEQHVFYDRLGRSVYVPRNDMGRTSHPWFDDGYAKALWDFRNDSLLLGDDNRTLYVRDVDRSGHNTLLNTWHAISSLESEYHVPKAKQYFPWNDQLRVECSKLDKRVRHGIKFNNCAFLRTQGRVQRLCTGDSLFDQPYELTFDVAYDSRLVGQAIAFLRDVTESEHSAQNLCRMFATPLLEPYKHLSYVLYGDGGNGKGILLGALSQSFPDLAKPVDAQKILGGRRGQGGFSSDQEANKLIGTLWVFDEDADTVTVEQMTALKKISTGDTISSRKIQQDSVDVKPRCTFVLATNNPVITTMTAASARRFVYVRMRDNRKASDFRPLLEFRSRFGVAPFIMASCSLWLKRGDEPFRDVVIGDPIDLSEAEQWLVDQIVSNGYAISGANPYPERALEHKNSMNKLGLKTGVKKIDGVNTRVLTVEDEQRFSPYRVEAESAYQLAENLMVPEPPDPIDMSGTPVPLPSEFGFVCDYVPVGQDKKALNWKKLTSDDRIDTSSRPDCAAFAVVPAPGFMVIDMDKDKTGGDDGWDIVNSQIGSYSSSDFPATYLVKTPSGGVHAYYRIPDELLGIVKNMAHPHGIPVDTRVEQKGYVVGAGSSVLEGTYQLCDIPDNGDIPFLSSKMILWLKEHGYVKGVEPMQHQTASSPAPTRSGSKRFLSSGKPDMSPIPKGSRNNNLHAWGFGRLTNHPDNKRQIESDFFERGRISGLGDAEIRSSWNSILRQLGYQS
ncbi:bifunctional DNA primase/polymerase [Bifidobacterium imperatoris]|uniref:Bifunctional DNA primase/polymerase n=2 Tax=Bifidobacterium imperatoris TaxID=2020965 RepID=A0ABX7S376_9BIFI|nr:bifunctional DNA primase/polymerase [Bifidobacterium imperatoris]QSY57819.1 bifunctional DNA primase/polymerase [Bifidobacterium imperatoris]